MARSMDFVYMRGQLGFGAAAGRLWRRRRAVSDYLSEVDRECFDCYNGKVKVLEELWRILRLRIESMVCRRLAAV